MTVDDIKKAFDICGDDTQSCTGCPLLELDKRNGRGCKYNLFTSVLNLVIEQDRELERLRKEVEKDIRQAKIDVLNKVRKLDVYGAVSLKYIDALIKEIEDGKDN